MSLKLSSLEEMRTRLKNGNSVARRVVGMLNAAKSQREDFLNGTLSYADISTRMNALLSPIEDLGLTLFGSLLSDLEETVNNGSFTGNADFWALSGNWAYDTNNIVDSAGSTGLVVQPISSQERRLVEGVIYTITFTISNRTQGSVTMSLGGTAGSAKSTNGAKSDSIAAGSDGLVSLASDADFDGNIDNISVSSVYGDYNDFPFVYKQVVYPNDNTPIQYRVVSFNLVTSGVGAIVASPVSTLITPFAEFNEGDVVELLGADNSANDGSYIVDTVDVNGKALTFTTDIDAAATGQNITVTLVRRSNWP